LLLVEGTSGSGKTLVSRYIEETLGFERYAIDGWLMKYLARPAGFTSLGQMFPTLPRGEDFWQEFLKRRACYDWEDARDILRRYEQGIRRREDAVPESEKKIIGYVLFGNYMQALDRSLREKRDVVQEGGPKMRRIFFRLNQLQKTHT